MFRSSLRHAIPSMFHRRLLLLAVITALMLAALGTRALMMTTGAMHAGRKQQVEGALARVRYAPTKRGRILDRAGLVLAEDRPGWNITVHYSVLSGAWVKEAARRAARSDPDWAQSSDVERDRIVSKWQDVCAQRQADFWQRLAQAAKVDPQVLFDRQDALVRKISTMRDNQLRAQWLKKIREANLREGSREAQAIWSDLQESFVLPEERAQHAILTDLEEAPRLAVQDILDEPEPEIGEVASDGKPAPPPPLWQRLGIFPKARPKARAMRLDSPWRLAELQLVRARRYPHETVTLSFDRSTLPRSLRDAKPLDLTVRGVGMHVLGYTRKAGEGDLESAPLHVRKEKNGPYAVDLHGLLPGDFVGAAGVEKSFEDALRGRRGEIRVRQSALKLAGEDHHLPPEPGHDVQLALDIKLQAKVEAAMSREVGLMRVNTELQPWSDGNYYPARGADKDGREYFKPVPKFTYADLGKGQLNGAAVVLDAASGEVLAAVSSPGIALEDVMGKPGDLWADTVNEPMAERVAGRALLPGSVMKPLVLAAAISEGVYQPGEIVDIPGYPWKKSPHAYRDFAYVHSNPHTPLGKHELAYAIAVSSSPPFVMLAQTREDWSGKPRLGPARTLDWFDRFGFGHAPNAGMPASRGQLGARKGPTPEVDACLTAMGQGNAILASPLQVATAYCRLLNGHFGVSASFLKRAPGWRADAPAGEKRIAPEAIAYVLKGMWMATHHAQGTLVGTDRWPTIFNCPGVNVWGKSGTAQTWPQRIDSNGNKKIDGQDTIVRAGDHGWAVVLCAPEGERTPRFVIVTMLEYGGSGGRAGGPIANQIIHALKAEGYLEKVPKASPAPAVVNPDLHKTVDEPPMPELPAIDPDLPAQPQDDGSVL